MSKKPPTLTVNTYNTLKKIYKVTDHRFFNFNNKYAKCDGHFYPWIRMNDM